MVIVLPIDLLLVNISYQMLRTFHKFYTCLFTIFLIFNRDRASLRPSGQYATEN